MERDEIGRQHGNDSKPCRHVALGWNCYTSLASSSRPGHGVHAAKPQVWDSRLNAFNSGSNSGSNSGCCTECSVSVFRNYDEQASWVAGYITSPGTEYYEDKVMARIERLILTMLPEPKFGLGIPETAIMTVMTTVFICAMCSKLRVSDSAEYSPCFYPFSALWARNRSSHIFGVNEVEA
jgi:hypothetical protein